jgi:hypothetical protein
MAEEHDYHVNKRPDRTYISSAFEDHPGSSRLRMMSKVVDAPEVHEFAEVDGEKVIVVKPGHRHEILAIFYEDTRNIKRITIQKFDTESGEPVKQSFTFRKNELEQIDKALQAIRFLDLDDDESQKLDDEILDARLATDEELRRFMAGRPDIVEEIVRSDITGKEVVALAYRKEQLSVFRKLMTDELFFATMKQEWGKARDEDVWQHFFERNTWIFGHGLDYVFRTALDDHRLEQYTSGFSVSGAGKRVDALMKSRGVLNVLCFVELKTHKTRLIGRNPRSECWSISNDLADAVAQVQKTVNKAVLDIQERLEITDKDGFPTGEFAYLCQPKSYIVIGNLDEFVGEHGPNHEQFTSFEMFRRQCTNPEIITFDELYERARFIVHHEESPPSSSATEPERPPAAQASVEVVDDGEIPF